MMFEFIPCLTLVFYALEMVWLMHHAKFWAPLTIFKSKKWTASTAKGCVVAEAIFFCNTMLDDGVKETTAAIAVTEIAEIFNLATG